jgi:uncharacterized protein
MGPHPVATLLALAAVLVVAAAGLAVGLLGEGRDSAYDDPFDRFPSGGAQGTDQEVPDGPDRERDLDEFLTFVVGDIQRFWAREFERAGEPYEPAQVVVFHGTVTSGCGPASAATGPFYCPADQRVYLDVGFFRQLALEFRAPGDFAQAYVIAHELGHHVQNITGIMAQVMGGDGGPPPNEVSIRLELQADCLAGVWGRSTYERKLLERGDLDEALRAAAAVGDDRIQARTTGRIDPENWTHGSSEQRRTWFVRGFESGEPAACDTFSAAI